MQYIEEYRDLFSVPKDYYLVHCISADFGMGAGIAVEFNKHFNMKHTLQSKYPGYLREWAQQDGKGACILEDRVLNLITKTRYYHKPTYASITAALVHCCLICIENDIQKIAMPLIGCGLDQLEWEKVSEIIKKIFSKTDIEILVCKQ